MFILSQQDGIKFSTSGDLGTANVTVRQTTEVKKLVGPGVRCWAQPVNGGFMFLFAPTVVGTLAARNTQKHS